MWASETPEKIVSGIVDRHRAAPSGGGVQGDGAGQHGGSAGGSALQRGAKAMPVPGTRWEGQCGAVSGGYRGQGQ